MTNLIPFGAPALYPTSSDYCQNSLIFLECNRPMHRTTERQSRQLNLSHWLTFFAVFGVILRYALNLPIWGDEGFLGINILDRSFHDLLRPMEYIQVAPLGFLWLQRAV